MIIKNTVGIEFPECVAISEFTFDSNPILEDGWYAALKFVRQKQWKPTEEQLESLECHLSTEMPPRHKKIISELYTELQKL